MPYTITITGESFSEMKEKTLDLANEFKTLEEAGMNKEDLAESITEAIVEEEPKPTKKKKSSSKKKKASSKKAKKEPVIDMKTCINSLSAVVDELGKPAAKQILKEFGVAKLSELEEDQFKEFIGYCKETLTSAGNDSSDEDDDDVF